MKILFIGNSHTFYNSMPFQVRQMLRLHDPSAEVSMVAVGGMTLGWHAGQPMTQGAIQFHEWDAIVLQQKTHPFDGAESLSFDCRALQSYLKRSKAKVWMYMTWAEKKAPENQAILDQAFTQVAAEIGATLAPVSKVWGRMRELWPEIELYDSDQEHASAVGSYLIACTFYSLHSGKSAVGLPRTIVAGEMVLANISEEVAGKVQRVVGEVIS